MSAFIVATDSASDIPIEMCREYDIHPLMITYTFGDEEFEDTLVQEDCHAFYDRMRAGEVPHTSQPNPTRFVEFWESIMDGDLPIIHICLGGGVSGTVQSGRMAVEMMQELHPEVKVYFIDSTLESFGYGGLAVEAAKMAREGKTAEETVEYIERVKPTLNSYYTTGDLSYLYRSGRLSKASFVVAKALNIWPIMRLDLAGHLLVYEKCRGKKATYSRIHELIDGMVENPEEQTLIVCHTDCFEQAKEWAEGIQARFGFKDIFYTCVGPTIGTHAGPGLMAIFFRGKSRFD